MRVLLFQIFFFSTRFENKGSFGPKTFKFATFSEMDQKYRFLGQNYLYFWDFVEKKKIWNSKTLHAWQDLLSKIFSPMKFIFLLLVHGVQIFIHVLRPVPIVTEQKFLHFSESLIKRNQKSLGPIWEQKLCKIAHPGG